MPETDPLFDLLRQVAPRAPLLLAYLVGMGVAVANLRRCPGPAVMALFAMAFLLLGAAGATACEHALLPRPGIGLPGEWERYTQMMTGIRFAEAVVDALALGLLLFAIFSPRGEAPREPAPEAAQAHVRPESREQPAERP